MNTKVILLTGGSAGIGQAAAELLISKGCIVYTASRNPNPISHPNLFPVKMDVNNEMQISEVVKTIIEKHGRIDVLICNAGFGIAGAVEDCSTEEIKSQFETNYFGVVKTIQACLPQFRKQEYGKIISISSVAGVVPIPYQLHYSAVKAAILILMKGLHIELQDFGIQCCTILPGDTKTNFTKSRIFAGRANDSSVYYAKMKRAVGKMEQDEQNGKPASFVAQRIVKQVFSNKMKREVVPGIDYAILTVLGKILPVKLVQFIVKKLY